MPYLYFVLWVQILSPFSQMHRSMPPAPAIPGSLPPPPAGMTDCTGHRHVPWNFSSTSSPTRASQPRTYKIWTKQPLWQCHIEDTYCSAYTKKTKSLYRPISTTEPHLDAPVISKQAEHPKSYRPRMLPQFPPPCSPAAYLHLCWAPLTHCLHTQAAHYFHGEPKPAAALHLQTHALLNPPWLKLIVRWQGTTPMRSWAQQVSSYLPPLPHSSAASSGLKAVKSRFFWGPGHQPPSNQETFSPSHTVSPCPIRRDLCHENNPPADLTFSLPAYESLLTLSGSSLIWLLFGEWPVPPHWFPTASTTALLQSAATRLAALQIKRLSITPALWDTKQFRQSWLMPCMHRCSSNYVASTKTD